MYRRNLAIGLAVCALSGAALAKPATDGIYPEIKTSAVPDDLSPFRQPQSLLDDLKKIQAGSLDDRIKALADKSKRDQVFVQGGSFQMGDFGPEQSQDKLPWTGQTDTLPLHQVTLDSYSISKYKVTFAEFDLYSEANKLPKVVMDDIYVRSVGHAPPYRTADKPAGVTWEQARGYCQWLGKQANQAMDLPTEAQWEYAARNRGKFIVYPTDNGKLLWNVNVPSLHFIQKLSGPFAGSLPYAIGYFPPTPLGLYDLTRDGFEWTRDWYASDYYSKSEGAKNPAGPASGEFRVERGWSTGDDGAGMTISRDKSPPADGHNGDGFRCAVQSQTPVR